METPTEARDAQLPRYKSHKIVRAMKLKRVFADAAGAAFMHFEPEDSALATLAYPNSAACVERCNANESDAGYLVFYPDGFISWSPSAAFEDGYTPLEEEPS